MSESHLSELEVLRDLPGYQAILRTVLKAQIKQLVEQLSFYAGEEAVLLSTSITDGTLSHIGSKSGESFLNAHGQVKALFLGFCMRRHHHDKILTKTTKDGNTSIQPNKKRKLSAEKTPPTSKNVHTENKKPSECSTNSYSETIAGSDSTQGHSETETVQTQSNSRNEQLHEEQGGDRCTYRDVPSVKTEESDLDSEASDNAARSAVDLFYVDGTDVVVKQEIEDPDFVVGKSLHKTIRVVKADTESDVSIDDIINNTSSVGEDSTCSLNAEVAWVFEKDQVKLSKDDLYAKYGRQRREARVKYRRNSASFQKKYQAIMAVESGNVSKCEVAKQFCVPQNTLSSWLKSSEQIKKEYLRNDYDPKRERARKSKHPEIEKLLLEWARDAKTHNIPLRCTVVMEKANEIARNLGYTEEQFTCKVGWAERFKLRFGLNVKKSDDY